MSLPPERAWRRPGVLRRGDVALRPHRPEDVADVVAQSRDPESVRFTVVPSPYGEEEARAFLAVQEAGWRDGTRAGFAVEVGGRYCGTVDLRCEEVGTRGGDGVAPGRFAELGYGLGPWARGRGVARRAVALALRWGFTQGGVAAVRWHAVVGNEASRRVALACGVRVEGQVRHLLVHRGERHDGWVGTLTAAEFLALGLGVPEDG